MNRRLLTSLLILVCSSLIVNECYAWPPEPDVYISDWHKYTTLGEDVDVYAEVLNYDVAGPIDDWDWTKPSQLYFSGTPVENAYDSTATFYSYTPGEYEVYAKGTDYYGQWDEDYAYVYVIDVEITDLQTTPYLVGSGNVTVSYTISPSGFTADSGVLEVRDKNGTLVHSDSNISKTGGPHTATWSGSSHSLRTVHWNKDPYEFKIIIAKDTATCYDTTSMTVIQSAAFVYPEDSPNTGSPITECMEGRQVTYTANAAGFVVVPTTNPVYFTFFFQHADGTPWSAPKTDWSFDLVEDYTAVADDVLDGDTDHNFDTPIKVTAQDNYGHFATSNYVWIKVWELWIEYFRDAISSNAWKVVVGKPIAYSAISAPYCKSWNWDMPEGFPDVWNPTGGNAKTGTAMLIPNSDLPTDDDWDHFGDTYGKIKVFCEDEEGNNHTFYSTDMSPSQRAQVFFDPSVTTHPGGGSDNWFYYWKYALFGSVSNATWNAAIMYGSTSLTSPYPIEIGDNGNNDYLTPYSHTSYFGYARPTADGKSRIDLFYSVLTHELQHRADGPYYDQGTQSDADHLPDNRDNWPYVSNGAGYSEYTGANLWMGDWEYNARSVENVTAPASADWSEEGKQW